MSWRSGGGGVILDPFQGFVPHNETAATCETKPGSSRSAVKGSRDAAPTGSAGSISVPLGDVRCGGKYMLPDSGQRVGVMRKVARTRHAATTSPSMSRSGRHRGRPISCSSRVIA